MIQPHPFHVYLVTGPPLAGKTTYVQRHMTPGDLVLDLDLLAAALSMSPVHEDNPKNIRMVWRIMDAAIVELAVGANEAGHRAWIVGCFRVTYRNNLIRFLRPERVIVLATSLGTCFSRLKSEVSSRPKGKIKDGIKAWWAEWDGIAGAEVIGEEV